ncbi:unnamed protein product [marine sediment metagenome]|uniref:Uncharacterized protein n=1 Tax=marine sediment metagenome TaxID=412755 RepID=X1D6E6_9ZZZZ
MSKTTLTLSSRSDLEALNEILLTQIVGLSIKHSIIIKRILKCIDKKLKDS